MDYSSHPREQQQIDSSSQRMSVLVPPHLYQCLERQAQITGETVAAVACRLLNDAIRSLGSN